MHSSRMRTGRSLTVLCQKSAFCGGVCSQGGLLPGGVCSQGGSAPGEGGIPACTEADPLLWTESQMPVKTLPWPNFVVAGNNNHYQSVITKF